MIYDLALTGGIVCDGCSSVAATVLVKDGKIWSIADPAYSFDAKRNIDCNDCYVLPGFIDPHVHLKLRLGNHESVDDFITGSELALSGGVTTIADFVDPAHDCMELEEFFRKRLLLAEKSKVDFSFHATLAGNPASTAEDFSNKALSLGCPTIKVFTTYSDSARKTEDGFLLDLLDCTRKLGTVVLVHAENDEIVRYRASQSKEAKHNDLNNLRPVISEREAVSRVVLLAAETDGQAYVVHVSAGSSIVAATSTAGYSKINIVLETCPQYLMLTDASLNSEKGALFACVPPLRGEKERALLLEMLKAEKVSTVGTDHCPFLSGAKLASSFLKDLPLGIGTLGLTASIIWSLLREEGISLFVRVMSSNAARRLGLYPDKGSLLPGTDADLVVFDPEGQMNNLLSGYTGCDYTPYEGLSLAGRVKHTVLRGRVAYEGNEILLPEGYGRFIGRDPLDWSVVS